MKNLKHKKFYKKVQLVTLDRNGHIIYTDANLFPGWEVGDVLAEVHPFFEIIDSLLLSYSPDNNEFTFPCVHLSTELTEEKICDVTVTIEIAEINIVIFDYTKTYQELNIISQKRNQSLLEIQQLEFSNKLIAEKEEFKNDLVVNIQKKISESIISITTNLERLESSALNTTQKEFLYNIKKESQDLLQSFNDILD